MLRIGFRDKSGKRKTSLTYGKIDLFEDGIVTLTQNREELYLRCLKKKMENTDTKEPVIVYTLDSTKVPEILAIYNTRIRFEEFRDFHKQINSFLSGEGLPK